MTNTGAKPVRRFTMFSKQCCGSWYFFLGSLYVPSFYHLTYEENHFQGKQKQDGDFFFTKNSRTIQEHFKNILSRFKNKIKRPEK